MLIIGGPSVESIATRETVSATNSGTRDLDGICFISSHLTATVASLHKIGFSMTIQLLNDLFLLSIHSLFSLLFLFLLLIDPRGGRRVPLFASQYPICHTILYTYSGAISTGTTAEYGERRHSASFHGCGTVKTNLGGMINTKCHLSLEGK